MPLTVAVPGGPSGTVYNGTAADFVVSQNGKSGSARFLFSTEGGMILGWSPTVNAATAIPGVDRSSTGAVYKGLTTMSDRLYATDFHNNRVDVFDASFAPVPLTGAFQDKKLPKGYAPFGIQALAGNIFVTFAKQDSAKHDDVAGPGLGYVDEFTADGKLVARVASGGRKNAPPNAPWGLALAPSSFGVFAGDVLIGNFGNGRISAYQQRGSEVGVQGSAAPRRRDAALHRGVVGDRVRKRRGRGSREHALLRRRPGRRAARAVRRDHRDRLGRRGGPPDPVPAGRRYSAGTQSRVRYSQNASPAHSR